MSARIPPDHSRPAAVAELQGLYGPFTFPEKLLQKIWLRGDFDRSGALLQDGSRIDVVHPGRWNLLGGPDFKGARLRLADGREVTGDVEIHLHAADWVAHRHADDPAYDGVILHVVLFPPAAGHVTRGRRGEIPVLALLPRLHHDLEEYAAEDAVETLANRPAARIMEVLGPLPPDDLFTLLGWHAAGRWHQKVHFARARIERLGWTEACHQTALEILGYRFNRAPMLRVAALIPLAQWSESSFDADATYDSLPVAWSLQGLRPANHPRVRLRQYAAWARARPRWPDELAESAPKLPQISPDSPTGDARRAHRLTALRAQWGRDLCGGAVGGSRLDTLICDGFLPLLAAHLETNCLELWRHWFAGDLPAQFPQALRQLGVFSGRTQPACHGAAQGLLGWMIERERAERVPSGRGA